MSCTWSVRVCVQTFAIVRRGVYEEIGPRQNKQTFKYLVDDEQISQHTRNIQLNYLALRTKLGKKNPTNFGQ